jgi:hypothetical protein
MNLIATTHAHAVSPPSRGGLLGLEYLKLTLPAHGSYIETRGSNGALMFHKPRSRWRC